MEFTNLNRLSTNPSLPTNHSINSRCLPTVPASFPRQLASFDGQLLSRQPHSHRRRSYDRIASRFGTTGPIARSTTLAVSRCAWRNADGATIEEIHGWSGTRKPSHPSRQNRTTPDHHQYSQLRTHGKVEPTYTPKTHTVRKGDTVYSISRRYDLSVPELLSSTSCAQTA